MPPPRASGAAALAALSAAMTLVPPGAGATRALPRSPTYLYARASRGGLQVRPPTITYTGDGTGFLGGRIARSPRSGIRWGRWVSRYAAGTGYNQLNDCRPSCARGRFSGFPVYIVLWRPRWLGGNLVYTRLTIYYTGRRPGGEPRHYTFTDILTRGHYGWGPPDEHGYCVGTYGQPPAAGCRNIHSVP